MFFNLFSRNNESLTWSLVPMKFPPKSTHNIGGKCILPQSILEELVAHQVRLPYSFEISHTDRIFRTNIGVLEFTGVDGIVVVPEWIFYQLDLESVPSVDDKLVMIPIGQYVKLLPHHVKFLEIENPKAELEKTLRNYQVLTQGDEILCSFDSGRIRFTVAEIKPPGDGIYIVDTDLEVEFLPPVGYEEKIDRERTVERYVEYVGDTKPREIRMKELGLFFGYKDDVDEKIDK